MNLLRSSRLIAPWIILTLFTGNALADPCTAQLPRRAGATFSGEVRYVGDGDSLCVGASSNPATWIEVRLADFNAPELSDPQGAAAKAHLERAALHRPARCEVRRGRNGQVISFDRVIAVCSVGGRRIGDLLRATHAPEGGR